MGRPRARVGRDPRDRAPVELDREARRQVMRDEDCVRPRLEVDGIVVREVEQERQEADVHVDQVADPLAHHRVRRAAEVFAPLQHHQVERLLGGEVLPHEGLDARAQFDIAEDGDLHLEDHRLRRARILLGPGLHAAQALHRRVDRRAQARDLGVDLAVLDHARPDLRHLPAQEVGRPDHDAGRGGDAVQRGGAHSVLPELVGDQQRERLERPLGVGALGAQPDRGPALGGEHHHPHDALRIHLEVVARDGDVGLESAGGLHDLGGRTGVDPVRIDHLHGTFWHQRTIA